MILVTAFALSSGVFAQEKMDKMDQKMDQKMMKKDGMMMKNGKMMMMKKT